MKHADTVALRVVQHMLAGEGFDWGIEIEEAQTGYARISMTVRTDMTNSHGIAHGGMIFALADTACAYASNTYNEAAVTAGASIIFLAPARIGDVLIAEAREIARSGRNSAYAVSVRAGDNIIAQFQGQSRTIGGAILALEDQEKSNG